MKFVLVLCKESVKEEVVDPETGDFVRIIKGNIIRVSELMAKLLEEYGIGEIVSIEENETQGVKVPGS